MLKNVLRALCVMLGVLALAILSFEAVGPFNRWRYARRLSEAFAARPPATFYVAVNGSDMNSGRSLERAWRSISKVNQMSFVAGDYLLFEGGGVFTGNLVFESDDIGTPKHPIQIGSFGSGRAKLLAQSGNGIYVHDSGGFEITNLIIGGSGPETNKGNGIIFQNDLLGGVKIPYVRITSVEVSGFGKYGICLAGNRWKSGFRDVRITSVSAHDNVLAGMYIYGGYIPVASKHAHRDVYIGHSTAFNNSGVAGPNLENSGSGIVVSDVDRALVEQNSAFNNGWLSNSTIGGPVGIWTWDSDSVTIQSNRSFENRTSGMKDGGGFDLDGAVTNSTLQYNYSHDNDGAGYLICQFPGGRAPSENIVRYNVSENDARKNGYGGIHLFGGVEHTEIYNNTVFIDTSAKGRPVPVKMERGSREVHFRNNAFYAAEGLSELRIEPNQTGLLFQGNGYLSLASYLTIEWQGSKFKSLSEWRAATRQETMRSRPLGVEAHAPTINLTLNSGSRVMVLEPLLSSLVDAGLDLRRWFGFNPGARDFYGHPIPGGSGYDIGAKELQSAERHR
jgi:Right handed beta helix region